MVGAGTLLNLVSSLVQHRGGPCTPESRKKGSAVGISSHPTSLFDALLPMKSPLQVPCPSSSTSSLGDPLPPDHQEENRFQKCTWESQGSHDANSLLVHLTGEVHLTWTGLTCLGDYTVLVWAKEIA